MQAVWTRQLTGSTLEEARDGVMRTYNDQLQQEVEPFLDYLWLVKREDQEELSIPDEKDIDFDYGPETEWKSILDSALS